MIKSPAERETYKEELKRRKRGDALDQHGNPIYERWPLVVNGVQQPARKLRDFPGVPLTVCLPAMLAAEHTMTDLVGHQISCQIEWFRVSATPFSAPFLLPLPPGR